MTRSHRCATALSGCQPRFLPRVRPPAWDIRARPPIMAARTAAPATIASARPINDPSGSLKVTVSRLCAKRPAIDPHRRAEPQASTWGFQITIREQSDQTLSSGTFAIPIDDGAGAGSVRRRFAVSDPRRLAAATSRGNLPSTRTRRRGRRATLTNLMCCGRRLRRRSAGWRFMSPPLPPTATALRRAIVSTPSRKTLKNAGNCATSRECRCFNAIVNGASFQPGFLRVRW